MTSLGKKEQVKVIQMGPLIVLVCPCFSGNIIVTCKIESFLCSLDNFLLKNLIVFFFGNQIPKWCSFEKRVVFDVLFTFFSHQGRGPSAHISLTYIHTRILLTLLTFLHYQFCRNYKFIMYGFSLV